MENNCDFALLPPHVLTQILNHLSFRQILSVSRTCKSWFFASCDPTITKRVRLQMNTEYHRLNQWKRPLTKLQLTSAIFSEFNCIEFFAEFGRYITEFVIVGCTLSAQQLAECLKFMTKLSILIIMPNRGTISNIGNLIDSDVASIKPILNRLQHFSVMYRFGISNSGGIRLLMSMMTNLKTLHYESSPLNDLKESVNDLFSYIYLSNLEKLEVECSSEIARTRFNQDFSRITAKLNLNSFTHRSGFRLLQPNYDTNFKTVCKKLENLKILTINSIDENHLDDICRNIPQLIELTLNGIIPNKIEVIGKLQYLRKLSISSLCNPVLDEDQVRVFTSLKKLTDLQLYYKISPSVLNAICTNCKNLIRLELSRMETKNLEVLFKNLLQLKYLDLSFSRAFGDFEPFIIDHDITQLQLLEHLNISDLVPGISLQLIRSLPNLRSGSHWLNISQSREMLSSQ